ncbi:exo-alpha-sialidase [Paenibacillus sp. MBLB4367]|uniref:exo-alpha-sialidase n=1 Tax=Paenibacillus sp. MBLB4367 TaxID=3384767 RepID=UPI0039083768
MRKSCLLLIFVLFAGLMPFSPAGSTAHAAEWAGSVGYLNNDSAPLSGSLANFGYSGSAYFDYFNRSIGIDLGESRTFNEIRLHDENSTNRVNSSANISVYISNDNVTYTQLSGWSFWKAGQAIVLQDFSVSARFVKVHSHFTDAGPSGTWLTQSNLQHMLEVRQVMPRSPSIPGTIGYVNQDLNPATMPIGNWGTVVAAALDYNYRSLGIDLGSSQPFNTIELVENQGPSRVEKTDLSVYVSNDNQSYTKVSDWRFLKLNNRIILYNMNASGRYIKVHNHFDDTSFTFSNTNLQNMIYVSNRSVGEWTASGGGTWLYKKSVQVSNAGTSPLLDRSVYIAKSALGTAALQAAGKLQRDFRDVRFADEANHELAYYMDDNGFYVNIPTLEPGLSTVYFYYGNASAEFVGAGQEGLQVEYGNKTLMEHSTPEFRDNVKPEKLANGDILMVANRVSSTTSGIYAKYSSDGGRTWTAQTQIVNLNDAGRDEPASLFVDPATGKVVLFFYSYYGYTTTNCLTAGNACRNDLYYTVSMDHGRTFAQPVKINTGTLEYNGATYPINYNVTYTNPIELVNGDWIFPFVYVKAPDGSFAVSVLISTDQGVTWTKSVSQLAVGSSGSEAGLSEPSIVQLADGSLRMYMRQQVPGKVKLAQSTSTDNGRTWSVPTDAPVFSSNTMSVLKRHSNHDILLLWPGNNSFGGTSYLRNPLTLAYSQDETNSWRAMRDLLGRTRLSQSAVNPAKQVATQPSLVEVDPDTYLFGWWGSNWSTATTLLVEDFNRYLYRSHGVFDDFEYSELKNDYWWELGGSISTSTNQSKSGASSLRLLDNNTTSLTAGSRLFPGIRKGTVKFSLYASNLSDLFSFSLREPYSYVHNAPGTVFQFMLEADGSLRVYNRAGNRVELPVQTDITTGTWHDIELQFDVAAKLIGVWVDGAFKGNVENYLDGNLITHFNIASASTAGTGTDVYIDNLMIQDTEAGLPIAGAVGGEQWADFTAPSTIAAISPAESNGSGGWYSRDVTVTLATYDNVPGVIRTEYRINGGVWSAYDQAFTLTADGMNKVEYRSMDSAGNVEDVKETTIRVDKTAPILSLTLDVTSIKAPNHKLVPIRATLNYSDGLSGIDSVVLRSITSNEPENGLGDGDQPNDIQDALYGTDDTSFSVRAERSGKGQGRVYTIIYAAIDKAGNETTASATVTIPHDGSGE